MSIEYKKFTTNSHYEECLKLQKEIFGFTELNCFSPLQLHMFNRKTPPVAITIGVFICDNELEELIGYVIAISTLEKNGLYVASIGVRPSFQNKIYGYKLLLKLKEIALKENIESIYGIIEPLNINIGKMYFNKLKIIGLHYEIPFNKATQNKIYEIPSDKILAKWDITYKSSFKGNCYTFKQAVNELPIVNNIYESSEIILIDIPFGFDDMKTSDLKHALQMRLETRIIFQEYMVNRNYIITNCLFGKIKNERKCFYLLEKSNFQNNIIINP